MARTRMIKGAESTEDLIGAKEDLENTPRDLTVERERRIHLGKEKVLKIQEL